MTGRKRDKRPKVRVAPEEGWTKSPRAAAANDVPQTKRPHQRAFMPPDPDNTVVIQFGRVDVAGPWCLSKITPKDHRTLLTKIRAIESMTVHEAFSNAEEPGKDYDAHRLPNRQAQRRLVDLELDDATRISRLRVSGTGRLYGFRRAERFYALWWDPGHEIWPSTGR